MLDIGGVGAGLLKPSLLDELRKVTFSAGSLDDDGDFPSHDIDALSAIGALAAPFGGTAEDTAFSLDELLISLRLIGHASLPLGRVFEGHVNAALLIRRYGTAKQQQVAREDAEKGGLFGVWNTEGSEGVRLVRTDGGLELVGAKTFASGAGFVDRPLITARDEQGQLFMVLPRLDAIGRADLSAWQAHGMRASATGTFHLTGLPIAPHDILGQAGDYHRQPHFSGGAWRFCAVQLGAMERLVEEARRLLRSHDRDGDPHQQARMGEAMIAVETARLWIEQAAKLVEADDDPSPLAAENIVAYVNLARCAVERCGLNVMELVQRSIGLRAFLRTNPLERICRDLATYLRQPGPDRALCEGAAYMLASEDALGELWR